MANNVEQTAVGAFDGPAVDGFPTTKADHAMGLELQIVELVEQQMRARVQHRDNDADQFEVEIAQLRAELAATADLTAF